MNDRTPNGAALLDRLRAALTRYVILPSPEAADAVTLWIAATHAQPAWAHAPRLVIRGPEKRCGKSRLLDVVEATCHEPLITVNASSAAVYRSITEDPPTMLVDEADTIFGPKADGNEDLRGLLNAGHQRNRPAIRYDAATSRVESIPTFAMAALAGIGAMPDTIEDRAVVIRMRRRAPGENVAPYRHRRDRPALRELAAELNLWLRADLPALEAAEPSMPVEDRAADTWEPLVAVADHAGGDLAGPRPRRRIDADRRGRRQRPDLGPRPAAGRLPHRVRPRHRPAHRRPAGAAQEPTPRAPWADHGPAGLTAMKLGTMLREYDIRSGNIRFPNGMQAKGYQRADFADAWARYCPALGPIPEADVVPIDEGEPVPAVPASSPQVRAGRLPSPGRHDPSHQNKPSQA